MDCDVHILACKKTTHIFEESSTLPHDCGWTWYRAAVGSMDILTNYWTVVNAPTTQDNVKAICWLCIDTVGVALTCDTTPAAVTEAILARFLLYDRRSSLLLDNTIFLIVSRQQIVWRLLHFCWLLVCTADCSLLNDVAWYPNFCNGAALWLLQYASIVCLVDCSNTFKKIPLWTYSSHKCGPLCVLSPSSIANCNGDMLDDLK